MFDGLDETRLLAYVEGELTPDETAALDRELADRPETRAALEQLRADRAMLASLAEPPLPADLTATIESTLARPMLIEPTATAASVSPGAWRRGQRRAIPRHRVVKLVGAVAAAVMLVTSVTLIALVGGSGGPENVVADGDTTSDQATPAGTPTAVATSDETPPTTDGVLHHHLPEPAALVAASSGDRTAEAPTDPVQLPFTLVVSVDDTAAWEQAAVATLEPREESVALVQNFSIEEFNELKTWMASRRPANGQARPTFVDLGDAIDAGDWKRFKELVLDLPAPQRPKTSEQLAGPKRLGASVSDQTHYSDRGATHTITVPLADLEDLLGDLARTASGTLQMLPRPDAEVSPSAAAWITDLGVIRAVIAELRKSSPNATVLLPVSVRQAD